MYKMMKRNGFTLIELLVTITVIAVLVLLAAPRLLGYTDKAKITELTVNTREIETAAERYYMDHDESEWPRLTDKPYTKTEVNEFAEKIYDITGEEVELDENGKYYDIDFDKLKPYIDVPGDKTNYILQNPVGKVYALYKPTEEAVKRLEKEEPLYEFDSFTFTNAGATGRFGPTQEQLDSAYTDTILEDKIVSDNGIQLWTVPKSGTYRIEAYGAHGGSINSAYNGMGAIMIGDLNIKKDETLKILVGQMGSSRAGGGGTFIATLSNTPLIVAGGGGASDRNNNNRHASLTPNGNNGQTYSGGNNGNGGKGGIVQVQTGNYNIYAGGGGGFYSNGESIKSGYSFINGGLGGNGGTGSWDENGGFGGGAGGENGRSRGGGGGFSGGGAGGSNVSWSTAYAGGGGSYNSGSNQKNSVGHIGHGKVVITYLGE